MHITAITTRPDQAVVLDAARVVAEEGIVQLNGLFPAALMTALLAEYQAGYRDVLERRIPGRLMPLTEKRLHTTLPLRGAFLQPAFCGNRFLHALWQVVLGSPYIVATLASSTSFPGAERQHRHRDQELLFRDTPTNDALPACSLCLGVPLGPLDAEIGLTAFARGSHRDTEYFRRYPDEDSAPLLVPDMQSGDALVWDNRTIHRGLANRSDRPRPLLLMYVQKPWFRNSNLEGDAGLQVRAEDLELIEPLLRPAFAWRHVPRRQERRITEAVGRNSPCPCGSGERYKHCCGRWD